jgi:hypothetical protein
VVAGQVGHGQVMVVQLVMVVVVVHHHGVMLHHVHGGDLVLLLPLHAPVLEPDLDLTLRQAQTVSYFDPPPPRQVAVEVEFLLQFQRLVARVRRPLPLCLTVGVDGVCRQRNEWRNISQTDSSMKTFGTIDKECLNLL